MQAILTADYDRRWTHSEMKNRNQESVRLGISCLKSQHSGGCGRKIAVRLRLA